MLPATRRYRPSGSPDPDTVSAYRAAIELTTLVIERRARSYRNLVVAVVLIGIASIGWALAARALSGLAGVLSVVPACGLFFFADARLLNQWRSGVLASWASGELDLAAFRSAVSAHPGLPQETRDAMLGTLPSTADLVEEQRILPPTRQAAAAASLMVHQGRADSLLLNTITSGITVSALVAALWMRTWTPLVGLVVLVLRPPVAVWMRRRRLAAWEAELVACRRRPGFSEADYIRLLAAVQ